MTERYVHRNNKNNEHRIVTPHNPVPQPCGVRTFQGVLLACRLGRCFCGYVAKVATDDPHLYAPAWKAKIHEEMTK